MSQGKIEVYKKDNGELRLRVDSGTGERAQSAVITDAAALIYEIEQAAGLTTPPADPDEAEAPQAPDEAEQPETPAEGGEQPTEGETSDPVGPVEPE